jgi:hypothetical protein
MGELSDEVLVVLVGAWSGRSPAERAISLTYRHCQANDASQWICPAGPAQNRHGG